MSQSTDAPVQDATTNQLAVSRTVSQDDTLNAKSGEPSLKRDSQDLEKKADVVDVKEKEGKDLEGGGEVAEQGRYLTGLRLWALFSGLLLSVFLVALDQTIVATALPIMASQFQALNKVSWIVSAYLLTQCGFMLTIGQLLTIIPTKWVYLGVIVIFELGSLFCGVAPNMEFLIFGRAIAGVGASGIMISILVIISEVTRLEQRPMLFGLFGMVFAIASVVGPLLGGVFTDHVSWRWCFYINLPLGALSIGAICILVTARNPPLLPKHEGKTLLQKLAGVDWVGSFLSVAMIVPFLLALQWGGNEYPWNDKAVIICFVLFGVITPVFVYWEYRMGDDAIMPLSLYKRITQVGTAAESFFVMFNLILGVYYLPFFYQAAKGRTATQAALDILPFMLSTILAAGLSGFVISFTGRYWWFLLIGPMISSIGAGLLYTINLETSNSMLIGLQILFGAGIGAAMQNCVIAIQTEYADDEQKIPQATSVLQFYQQVGGIFGIAIAGTVFSNKLVTGIHAFAPDIPDDLLKVLRNSVTVVATLPVDLQQAVIQAYVESLSWVYIIGVPTCIVGGLCAFMIKNYNVKEKGAAIHATML